MLNYKTFKHHAEIYITSPKYGEHTVFIDIEDLPIVKDLNWWVVKSDKTFYCCAYNRNTGDRKMEMHRLLMGFPDTHTDHKDQNGLNNRRCNLRIATHQENMRNKTINKRNKTGFRGVYFDRWGRNNAYRCAIKANGKTLSGNRFKNPLLAAYQYNKMSSHYYGEFAALNKFTKEQIVEIKKDPKFKIANTVKCQK